MNSLRTIFRTSWAFYSLLVFIFAVLIYLPFFLVASLFLPKSLLDKFAFYSFYFIPRLLFYPCLIRMKIYGKEDIDPNQNYVIVSNHQSLLDIFANPGTSPVFFKYLAKLEVHSMPVLSTIADFYCVYVDRRNKDSRAASFQRMVDAINSGDSILVYPEGTRNRTGEPLKEFYDGAFRLAIKTQRPLLVQTLVNSNRLSSPYKVWDLSPGVIHSYWDGPIATKGLTEEDISSLKSQVERVMLDHLAEHEESWNVAL